MVVQICHSDPPEIEARLWSGFPPGDISFYIGANCGQNFQQIAALTRQRLFAFEPCPASYDLAVSLAANYARPTASAVPAVDVLRLAVSDHDGTVDLAALPGTRQEATGQFVTIGTQGMEWTPPSWGDKSKVTRVTVPCKTLDSLRGSLGDPDFISIDTEGHELLILHGAGRLLYETRPSFLIEFHTPTNHDSCVSILKGHGYRTETVRHPHYPPRSPMWFQHGWIKAICPESGL